MVEFFAFEARSRLAIRAEMAGTETIKTAFVFLYFRNSRFNRHSLQALASVYGMAPIAHWTSGLVSGGMRCYKACLLMAWKDENGFDQLNLWLIYLSSLEKGTVLQ